MGVVSTIDHDIFPAQSDRVGKYVKVTYNYDTSRWVVGTIVRDDMEPPHRMIIHVDPDRYVLSTECQYADLDEGEYVAGTHFDPRSERFDKLDD
jgi:hypothetical protein